jgi:hypothetical protein
VWRVVSGFLEAEAILQELRDTDAEALVQAVDDAEAAFATASWNAEREAAAVGYLAEEARVRSAAWARARTARPSRLLASVRGDG